MTPGVDFFRVDRSAPTRWILIAAAVMVAVGASAVGAHLMHRLSLGTGHLVSLGGGLLMIAGLVFGFGSMAMMLFENVYLSIKTDGLHFHENGRDVEIAWDDLKAVVVGVEGKAGVLALERGSGEPVHFHAGRSATLIRAKIEEARRKAMHGLLAPS